MTTSEAATHIGAHRRSRQTVTRSLAPLRGAVLAAAVGVVLTLVSYSYARHSSGNGFIAVFWVGQLVALMTTLWVGTRTGIARSTQGWLLALFALFNFVPKLLQSPWRAVYFDEYGHWQQAQSMVATGSAFPVNTYQPILRDFPGLEWTTVGVHFVTHLSTWHSGQVVIGVAHIAALLAVWGMAHRLGLSNRTAYLAAVFYALNPSFQFFDSQYAYESLGLPLALVTIYCAFSLLTAQKGPAQVVRWGIATTVASSATTVTHHIAAFFAVTVVVAIVCTGVPVRGDESTVLLQRLRRRIAVVAATANVACLGLWLGLVAPSVGGYIGPHVTPAFKQLLSEFGRSHQSQSGTAASPQPSVRVAFQGSLSPTYEKIFAYSAQVALLLLVLGAPVVLYRSGRLSRAWITPLVLGSLYFASVPFALTVAGSEGAHRSWGYSFLGIVLLAAVSIDMIIEWTSNRRTLWSRGVAILAATLLVVVTVGEGAIGVNYYYRFPGPYLFGSDTRGNTAQTREVADWMRTNIPAGSHVVTDRYTGEVVTGFTRDYVPAPDQSEAYGIYDSGAHPSASLRDFLRSNHFAYFVLDTHIYDQLPVGGFFASYAGYTESINSTALKQIVSGSFAQLIYSDGPYRVYQITP